MKKLIFLLVLGAAGLWVYNWYVLGINLFNREEIAAGVPPFSISERMPDNKTVEIGEGRWRLGTPMPTARIWTGTASLGGRIYVAGGLDGFGRTLDKVEVYDPFNNSWSEAPPLPEPRHHLQLVSLEGKLYAVGGLVGLSGKASSSLSIYDPKISSWSPGAEMPTALGATAAVVVEDGIHIFGGRGTFGSTSTHLFYSLADGQWSGLDEMTTVRDSMPAVRQGDDFWIIGGRAGSSAIDLGLVEIWNLTNGLWKDQSSISTRRSDFSAGVAKGRVYLFGGESATLVFKDVVVHDPDTGKWLNVTQMPEPRHGFGLAIFNDMFFLIGGGHRPGWSVSDTVQVYIP